MMSKPFTIYLFLTNQEMWSALSRVRIKIGSIHWNHGGAHSPNGEPVGQLTSDCSTESTKFRLVCWKMGWVQNSLQLFLHGHFKSASTRTTLRWRPPPATWLMNSRRSFYRWSGTTEEVSFFWVKGWTLILSRWFRFSIRNTISEESGGGFVVELLPVRRLQSNCIVIGIESSQEPWVAGDV